MTPRIPKRAAGCPAHGGLVVPEVSARHTDDQRPPLFGTNHPGRVNACLTERRCGVCGTPLPTRAGGKYTLLLRPADFGRGYSAEPALHTSDCAPYAIEACPILNGTRTTYRRGRRDLEAERCGDPACDCQRWTNSADNAERAGAAVSPFYAAVYRAEDYRLHWGDVDGRRNVLLGVAVAGVEPLSIRLVTAGEPSFLDLTRALILGLPLDDH